MEHCSDAKSAPSEALQKMDTLGFEPRAFRMRSGCDTTTPCAQMMNPESARIRVPSYIIWIMCRKQTCSKCGQSSWRASSKFSSAVFQVSGVKRMHSDNSSKLLDFYCASPPAHLQHLMIQHPVQLDSARPTNDTEGIRTLAGRAQWISSPSP